MQLTWICRTVWPAGTPTRSGIVESHGAYFHLQSTGFHRRWELRHLSFCCGEVVGEAGWTALMCEGCKAILSLEEDVALEFNFVYLNISYDGVPDKVEANVSDQDDLANGFDAWGVDPLTAVLGVSEIRSTLPSLALSSSPRYSCFPHDTKRLERAALAELVGVRRAQERV